MKPFLTKESIVPTIPNRSEFLRHCISRNMTYADACGEWRRDGRPMKYLPSTALWRKVVQQMHNIKKKPMPKAADDKDYLEAVELVLSGMYGDALAKNKEVAQAVNKARRIISAKLI
jgi:hypothetical protein